tara:strand:- start:164 stop:559 length:396 start_codon:yes stop_codon:yes gene_type:complete
MLYKQILKFGINGLIGVLISFSIYIFLLNLDYKIYTANIIGVICGLFYGFFANKFVTFKNHNKDYTKLISKYFMLYTISLFIHVQINLFFVTQLESYKFFIEFSYAIATGVSALINFIGLKVLVFKEKDDN